ncbi:MAG: PQQ-dependent sugar dehydrogenase [Vicinamibacterales bacterium]
MGIILQRLWGSTTVRLIVAAGCVVATIAGLVAARRLLGPWTVTAEDYTLRVRAVARWLDHPWSLVFLPNGDALVTERIGRLRVLRGGTDLDDEPVAGTPTVSTGGQGGLFDVALHPRFEENHLLYLAYAKPGSGEREGTDTTALLRARLEGHRLLDAHDIFVADAWARSHAHYGGRIAFGRDGLLYLTIGERDDRERAQDLTDHAGSVVRLRDDGTVPEDNPFVGQPNVRPEIYTNGHRSPQGLVVHPQTGELWEGEQGPLGGDELNVLQAGRNYGWPLVTYGREYSGAIITTETSRPGLEPPLVYWVPSIATTGLIFYTGDRFPLWRGHAFVGGLASRQVRRVVFDETRAVHQERLLPLGRRIRDVREGPDGFLYVLTDHRIGEVLQVRPATDER